MDFNKFIREYDFEGSIILLEGKRKVAKEDEDKLVALGIRLARQTHIMRFRSGNASGSDELFARGVCQVDPMRLEVITPYSGHRKKTNMAGTTYPLDEWNIAQETEVLYETQQNQNKNLVDRYIQGDRGRLGIKAAYLLRDTAKVTGLGTIPAATAAIFYDDLSQPRKGGTGHTMSVCERRGVPIWDQRVWMGWLEDEEGSQR